MSFKIKNINQLLTFRLHFLKFRVKFDCSISIFLKLGSQKYEILTDIFIQNEEFDFRSISSIEETLFECKKQEKKKKLCKQKPKLIFELCSKTYNAYAGELQLQIDSSFSQHRSKLQNSLDQNAYIVYSLLVTPLQSQKQQKQKNEINKNKEIFQQKSYFSNVTNFQEKKENIKQGKADELIKKSNQKNQNVKKVKFATNTNTLNNTKSLFSLRKSQTPNDSLNTSSMLKKKHLVKKPFQLKKQVSQKLFQNNKAQQSIQNKNTSKEEEKQEINLIKNDDSRKKFGTQSNPRIMIVKSKSYQSQNISKIMNIQKQLEIEREKCHKFQIQVQTKKNHLKQQQKLYKDLQKKHAQTETDLKKTKKQHDKSKLLVEKLKDQIQHITHKYQKKIQSLQVLNNRSDSKQKSYKTEMQQIYKKMQLHIKQKLQKDYQKHTLQEKIQTIQNQVIVEHQHHIKSIESQLKKTVEKYKGLQNQFFNYKENLIVYINNFAKNIAQLLHSSQSTDISNRNRQKMSLSLGNSTSFSQSSEYNEQEDYHLIFNNILNKSEKVVVQFIDNIESKRQRIKSYQRQLQKLTTQFNIKENMLEQSQKQLTLQKQKKKQLVQKFDQEFQNMRKQHLTKQKQYRKIIDSNIYQIQNLTHQIQNKNREIVNISKIKQSLQVNIESLQKSIIQKRNEHNHIIQSMIAENKKKVNQLQTQIDQFQLQCADYKQKNQKLIKIKEGLQKKIGQVQTKLKESQKNLKQKSQQIQNLKKENLKSQQNQKVMTKQLDGLKRLIQDITGQKISKEKQYNQKEGQLKQQVNNFKQNHKNLQQAKKALQQNKKKIQQQIKSLQTQKNILKQKLTKASNQQKNLSESLKAAKKQSQYQKLQAQQHKKLTKQLKQEATKLKYKLKKKQQFQNELQDEFQCTFDQLRQKLNFYIKAYEDAQKDKNVLSRDNQTKLRKFNMSLEGIHEEVILLEEEFQSKKKKIQLLKSYFADMIKMFTQIQKETSISSFYLIPIKDMFKKCQAQIKQQISTIQQVSIQLQKKREKRTKLEETFRKTSTTLVRRASVTPQSNQFDKSSPKVSNGRLQRKFSLTNNPVQKPKTFKYLKEDIKQQALSIEDDVTNRQRVIQNTQTSQFNQLQIQKDTTQKQGFSGHNNKVKSKQQILFKQKTEAESKKSKAIKRMNTLR